MPLLCPDTINHLLPHRPAAPPPRCKLRPASGRAHWDRATCIVNHRTGTGSSARRGCPAPPCPALRCPALPYAALPCPAPPYPVSPGSAVTSPLLSSPLAQRYAFHNSRNSRRISPHRRVHCDDLAGCLAASSSRPLPSPLLPLTLSLPAGGVRPRERGEARGAG